MGNDGACRIVGIRDVCLLTSTGCKMVLKEVCHVLDIRLNMIIGRMLDNEDYIVVAFKGALGNSTKVT